MQYREAGSQLPNCDQPAPPVSTGKGWWLGLVGLLFFAAFLLLVWGELSAFIKSRVVKK